MAKEIILQNGMKAIVDDEDYERVNQYNWCVLLSTTTTSVRNSKLKTNLGQFILGIESGIFLNHLNGDKLNFTKDNLKVTNRTQLSRKKRSSRGSSSKYKGVSFEKSTGKWVAQLEVGRKNKKIGRFFTEEEAAKAYNNYAMKVFGEGCFLNVINKDNSTTVVDLGINGRRQIRKEKTKKNKYRGVTRNSGGRFGARIKINDKVMWLGTYDTEIEAAKVYNEKAKELFGDKAILNEIGEEHDPLAK